MILVDSGPLVATIHAGDRHHTRCRNTLRSLREPLATVWPVVTEAMYLLGFSWKAQDALWSMLASEMLKLILLDAKDAPRMRELMRKYRDLPMDFADAALVCVAERQKLRRVFTLDRRDFEIYRPRTLESFEICPD